MTATASTSAFKLSSSLLGHTQDVKALSTLTQPSGSTDGSFDLLSCSRDATARRWPRNGSDPQGIVYASGQSGFLNAVASLKTSDGQTFILTAGNDTLVAAYPLESPQEPTHAFVGHLQNVCCLKVRGDLVYSGSWDKTAKIWKDWACVTSLGGHEQAVWDVLPLSDGSVLTAAADNLIRYFDAQTVSQGGDVTQVAGVFKGHTQPVRALALINESTFASAGNDGTVRLWDLKSFSQIMEFGGHDSFVYSLSYLPDTGELVSGGEDRSVRVWNANTGELKQTITLPAISVWCVAALPNGDIAAGSSDSAVRVFSRAQERWADEATLKDYEATLSNTAINPQQIGDVKKTDLPGPEALSRPGNKEGQVIMVKQADGSVEAHQWSTATRSWSKIGAVVDAVGQNRKQLFDGQEYDFVFDVDVEDGKPPLKLPYNATQNPYDAAQKFLARNNLPQTYLDEVVKFIEKNTGGIELGTASAGGDPYTGGQAYRTGGGGGPAPTATAPAAPVASSSGTFPFTTPLKFTQSNLPAMRNKIGQLNDQLSSSDPTQAMNAGQVTELEQLLASLSSSQPDPEGLPLSRETPELLSVLLSWPSSSAFPAIDLVRVLMLYAAPPTPDVLRTLVRFASASRAGDKDSETNAMLALRALANAFGTYKGAQMCVELAQEVLSGIRKKRADLNKNGKVALATVALNYSILAVQRDLEKNVGSVFVELLQDLLADDDSEVLYRALYATGNLLMSPNVIGGLSLSTVEGLRQKGVAVSQRSSEERITSLCREVSLVQG